MRIVEFSADSNEIEIVPISDWHIGSPQADMVLIKEIAEYIEKTPNCYTLINGDVCNNNTVNSVGSVFEDTMAPMDQVVTAAYLLQNIAKKGKIINFVSGNHEQRSERTTGLSLSEVLLAKLLQYDPTLNDRYCEDGAYTFLTLNGRKSKSHKARVCFTIFNLHGTGGGSKIGNKIQKLDDMGNIIQAHLFIRGHSHQVETHRGVVLNVNTNNHTIREESCVYVNVGSALTYGGYGARSGMKPLSRGVPVIKLKVVRKTDGKEEKYYRQIECVIKDRLYE